MNSRSLIKTIEVKDSNNVKTNVSRNVEKNETKIVIVGAGVSGLAAAQRLYELGIKDIIILDAQNRIGGRIFTVNHSNYLIELGAQWLHGAEENPLYNWLNDKNMLNDFEDGELGMTGMFCNNFGLEINQSLVKKFLNIMIDIKLSLSKNYYDNVINLNGFTNAGQVFRYYLELKMNEFKNNEEKSYILSLFDWFMRFESIENCSDSMDDVSITSYTDYTDFSDGDLLNFKNGYRSLLQWFCKQLPTEELLYLNKQVVSIESLNNYRNFKYLDENGFEYSKPILIKYKTIDNNSIDKKLISSESPSIGSNNTIICDHVIVTASLGFLKNNLDNEFFKPQLPRIKQDLIRSIGFGTVNKIILQFKKPFWNHNDHGIKLVWDQEFNDKFDDEFPIWVKDIISFDSVRKQPNLLIGWIGGHGAKLMELESDVNIAEICLKLINKFLPKDYNKPTKLIACVCSRWYSNPFTRGSYSFQSMASYKQNVDKLHEPIYSNSHSGNNNNCFNNDNKQLQVTNCTNKVPRILFAGEATAGKLYSTAHGAVISGWREADRLREYILI